MEKASTEEEALTGCVGVAGADTALRFKFSAFGRPASGLEVTGAWTVALVPIDNVCATEAF
jgi:hypothetical protein